MPVSSAGRCVSPTVADDPRRPAVSVLARLGPGVSFEQADARAAALAPQWNAEWIETGQTTRLGPLNELAAQGFAADHWWVRQRRDALFLLFGAVACVLLIACANAANLFLSHALSRRRELAIRAAAGAGRLRLCRQLCTESIVTSFLAGLLGLALAAWVTRLVATAVPPDLARELLNPIDVDARVASWAMLVSLLAGIAATLPPALRAVGGDLVGAIQGRGAGGTVGHRRFRGGMVAVQNALAVMLLIGARGARSGRCSTSTSAGPQRTRSHSSPDCQARVTRGRRPAPPSSSRSPSALRRRPEWSSRRRPSIAAAVCFLLATALAGASLPARRAARTDPLAALRTQ